MNFAELNIICSSIMFTNGTKHEETPRSEKSFGFFGMNEQIWSKYEALVK